MEVIPVVVVEVEVGVVPIELEPNGSPSLSESRGTNRLTKD